MTQCAFTFDSVDTTTTGRLMVREASGTYRVATPAEILAAGREAAEVHYARGSNFGDPSAATGFFTAKLRGMDHEVFMVAFLDTRHRLIACETLGIGTVDGCEIHAREVVKAALRHNAVAVLFAHPHPSGNPEPSAADRAVTARLKAALNLVDVRVLDHIIVGETTTSMAMRGLV